MAHLWAVQKADAKVAQLVARMVGTREPSTVAQLGMKLVVSMARRLTAQRGTSWVAHLVDSLATTRVAVMATPKVGLSAATRAWSSGRLLAVRWEFLQAGQWGVH